MRAPARHSSDYRPFEDLWPGERIGPPRARTGRKALLRGGIVLIILGGGWALLGDQAGWREWLLAKIAAVSASLDSWAPGPVEPRAPVIATYPSTKAEPPPAPADMDVPPPAAPPLTTGALQPPPASKPYEAPPDTMADPADPYQVRAEAVGLHPGLSRVLLTRLSPADYRNAGTAIQTAVAETPDNGVFVWPRQREPELALFQVRFVRGAASGCRRYVVTITKDRWLTTALPMEKCGARPGRLPSE
jgi:hypothetical protein